jgi:hypothetical protein
MSGSRIDKAMGWERNTKMLDRRIPVKGGLAEKDT